MRIGLYGMPTAGKTHILNRIDFLEVVIGSKLLRQYDPEFDNRDEKGRKAARKAVAEIMMKKSDFIMDGHYAFGDEIAFTEEDGKMYDVYIYLYIEPQILEQRMSASDKNRKYLKYNIAAWQQKEIEGLRDYCHRNMKDFYVVDNPPSNIFDDVQLIIDFISDINKGYSCLQFAKCCANDILNKCKENEIILLDGDKTLTIEDSSAKVLGYNTNIYDGDFYTGFQAWKQSREFTEYTCPELQTMPVNLNDKVVGALNDAAFILTSGHNDIWKFIATQLNVTYYSGMQMAAETKLFITKYLQDAGKNIIAYGDGMNDYYMLKQANKGYLVAKPDGAISKSLAHRDIGGMIIV